MKKTAFPIYAAVTVVLTSVGLLFKVAHYPGADILCIISFILTLVGAGWTGAFFHKKECFSKAFSAFACFAIVCLAWALLFKLGNWPGAGLMVLISLGVLIPITAIWGCISYLKHNK